MSQSPFARFAKLETFLPLLLPLAFATTTLAQETPCPFKKSSLTFEGSPVEQARCLLRHVKSHGALDKPLKNLPEPFEKLIGRPIQISQESFRAYLKNRGILETDLGGPIRAPLAASDLEIGGVQYSRYFIIHDASTPNYLDKPFPSDVNASSWEWNDLAKKWANTRVANVFVSRTGESITVVDFASPLPAGRFGTKFARDELKETAKALQIHIELIQPRRRDPAGSASNDSIAPEPGFTNPQLDRLALIYVAASLRAGVWMIPAFHAAIDAGIANAHDDPQNFDLAQWGRHLVSLLRNLEK